jgi:hypothetical protein
MKKFLLIYSILLVTVLNSLLSIYTEPTIWVSDVNFGMVKAGDNPNRKSVGTKRLLNAGSDTVFTCVGSSKECEVSIKNGGSRDIVVNSLRFKEITPEFVFVNAKDTSGFNLKPGESKTIRINFIPKDRGVYNAELIFYNNTNDNPEISSTIEGVAKFYERNTLLLPATQKRTIGEIATIAVNLKEGERIDFANLQEIDIEIKYDNEIISPKNIRLGNILNNLNFRLDTPVVHEANGSISVKIEALGNANFDVSGDMLLVDFMTYLPKGTNTSANVYHTISTLDNECVKIKSEAEATIVLNPVCVGSLICPRRLFHTNSINLIRPNPAGADGAVIEFETALDIWTEVNIFNTNSELVSTPVSENLKAGEYSYRIDTKDLPSGTYTIEFKTGKYVEKRNLDVVKGIGKPGLIANDYDWGRVRIHREKFPAGPYGNTWVPYQPQAILLENTGTQEVRIDKVDVNVIKGDKAAFIYNESDFTVILLPGEKKLVDVRFQPTTVGEHEIELIFDNRAGTDVRANLSGIGTVPKLSTYIEDFGSSEVGKSDIKMKKVRINNLNHEWADNLTITDFIVEPQQDAISENLSGYGSEGFRYDKASIFKTKPGEKVVLKPCETLEFDADFKAQKEGSHHARLKTVSDADEEGVSVWIGLGITVSSVEECKCKLNISIRPNPVVNNELSLHFTLFEYNLTEVRIFNLMGQLVQVPFSGELGTGEHDIRIDTRDLTTGMYNIQIRTGKYFVTRKFIIML